MARPGRADRDRPELSVVICTRNGADTIGEQLAALADQDADLRWEIVVVDNGSTDETVAVVRDADLADIALRVVDASGKAGLSYARNVGVDQAVADRIAFCDDDDVVARSWVRAMYEALGTHQLVAPAIEYERLNDPASLVGRARFQSERIETLFGKPVCAGACGVHRRLWERLGGNDETLTDTGEDFDFVLRAAASGIEPHFAPEAVYHHRLRGDARSVFAQSRAHGRSHAMLWARHGANRSAPRADLRIAAREWSWLLSRAVTALAGRNRHLWMRRAGRRIGRLEGSIRHRVFVP